MSFNLSRMDVDPTIYIRFFCLLGCCFVSGFMVGGCFDTYTATIDYQEKVDKGLVRYYDKVNGQWLWRPASDAKN